MKNKKNKGLIKLFANYYAFYLKTHCYHWNITGLDFASLHKMLDGQYNELISDIDDIAERIRALDSKVPASFMFLDSLKVITDPNENLCASDMLQDLQKSNLQIISIIKDQLTEYIDDVVTVDLLTQKLASREKAGWTFSALLS